MPLTDALTLITVGKGRGCPIQAKNDDGIFKLLSWENRRCGTYALLVWIYCSAADDVIQ